MAAGADVGIIGRGSPVVSRRGASIDWFGAPGGIPTIVSMSNDSDENGGRETGRTGARTADLRARETVERERHRHQLDEFLADAAQDVGRMRGMVFELEAGETATWERLENIVHNLAARSGILKLGVMNACARELQQLVDERQRGGALDPFFVQCLSSAIETLALEIDALKRA